ncbi:GSCFA domain-containing protein [Shewanella youngdeokensis]|uniref:GSCFA domain-containing protein n=1 Tax=Shewanella youngdeokensis TaxID=2999068 RepID=A0ABZ0K175_9GAMM|nr:GSCFA domain-containing protein [Shewanella sp. DAU334]
MSEGEYGSLSATREGSGPSSWAEAHWHARNVSLYPSNNQDFLDVQSCISQHLLSGDLPTKPVLTAEQNVITIGSCFAAELRHFLDEAGLSSNSFWIPSGLNNTFALKDFLSWVVTGKETATGYRYQRNNDGSIDDWAPEYEREFYLQKLINASSFVFTIGLAEIWEDTISKKVFWRGIPDDIFDEQRHFFRLSTVEENVDNLNCIISLLQSINPKCSIVFTLSPVPLKASFQDTSCMISDCVSKSVLRVALHQVISEKHPNIYYWPSFEIIKWLGCHLPYPVYGTDDKVVRHVSRYMVLQILSSFTEVFYGKHIKEQVFDNFESALVKVDGEHGQPPFLFKGTVVSA